MSSHVWWQAHHWCKRWKRTTWQVWMKRKARVRQKNTINSHWAPAPHVYPCKRKKGPEKTQEGGKDEIMGFKHPKRYKPQKRGQKLITRHHMTLELTRQKLHPETLHLKVAGIIWLLARCITTMGQTVTTESLDTAVSATSTYWKGLHKGWKCQRGLAL